MTKIRMNKEMPLSLEWMPQSTYMHNSLDHLLPGDRNQRNFVFIKQESEFLENTLNVTPSVQNIVRLHEVSSKENKEAKQQNDCSDMPITPAQTDCQNESPKILTEVPGRLCSRGCVDVVEMPTDPTSGYKYFFIYEDQQSKFVVLKALRSDTAKEVAAKLLDVLAIVGAPRVLQSGNGRKFAEQVVHELRTLWNDYLILHGDTPKCEVRRRDFKSSLESWVREHPSRTWREGLNFVQILHNTTYCCKNGKIPCDLLFRRNMLDSFHDVATKTGTESLWAEEEWIERSSSREDEGAIATTGDAQDTSDDINQDEENENTQSRQDRDKATGSNDFSFVGVKNEALANNTRATRADETDAKDESRAVDAQSLKCKYCQKQYMKLGHLKNHMRTHKAGRVLRCKQCGKTFSVPRLYDKHVKQSHGQDKLNEEDCVVRRSTRSYVNASTHLRNVRDEEKKEIRASREAADAASGEDRDASDAVGDGKTVKNSGGRRKLPADSRVSKMPCTLQCTYCKQKFSFPSVLERHMRSHTNERPYVCEVCNKSFKQLGHLSQHSLTHHDYRSFQCTVCGVKFDSLETLKQHTHSHRGDAPKMRDVYRLFECDCCKKVFTTKSVLERHIFTHTQERQFDCKVCGKRFKQAGHVKSHMLVHTGERRFQCTVCSKRFSLSNSLKKHMYVHNGEKPYQCDVCGARFLEKRNLNGHLLTHTNERPYCCKICGKRYTLADTLRRHVSAAHEDGRTYQCEICAKMFKQLAHLSVHKKVHNDERPFQCHLCEKNFKHKNVLKSHLAIHANVRPFECDVCKATFVRKTNLQTHISSAHMNERPYACTICGKRFKQISHLNGHVVVHSNLMPYKCDYCDRRCNRLDNLKKHMRLHTKNKE
ncbi:PREDICTED: putative zinc finger protein 724 isoform X2 [Dinoponera quadriceps]|uniref:Zinc finger protein 724 isoform X2 n=1 Tax=Dinoponera quadriceps TaxID=609295 RepID=A0A6P3WT71_DINQU|nr:PREDICTED: putative zinc finger protein 724 isoform X2 [Dinoponera quadriceps]